MKPELDYAALVILSGTLIASACTDIRSRKIPNLLTFGTMALMLAYYGFTRGLDGLCFSAQGLLLGTGLLLPVYIAGGMGAGDAKLMGAVGSCLGARGIVAAFLFAAIAGGLYAGCLMWTPGRASKSARARLARFLRVFTHTGRITGIPEKYSRHAPRLRYAIPIALGTAAAVVWHAAFRTYLP